MEEAFIDCVIENIGEVVLFDLLRFANGLKPDNKDKLLTLKLIEETDGILILSSIANNVLNKFNHATVAQ